MIKKVLDRTFWKFMLVGVANTVFGTAIMIVFYNVFQFGYWISSAANYIFGSMLSYLLNKIFTFQSKGNTKKTLLKFIVNISLCYLGAYGIAKPLVRWILSGQAQAMQDNIAMLAGTFFFIALNYCGQRFFVFREKQSAVEI